MGANPLSKWDTPEGESAYPSVGSNGNRVAASLHQPTIARRKASELSSVERSALLDELVDQLIALKRRVDSAETALRQDRLMLLAHSDVVNRRTFWLRLRWLWSGV